MAKRDNQFKINHYLFSFIFCLLSNILPLSTVFAFHLSGKISVIKQIEGTTHPILVFEDNKHRCISFDKNIKVLQSCILVNHKEQLTFDYYKIAIGTLLLNPNPKKILIIGVGGGILPVTFSHLLPNAKIEAIDINPKVIDIAKEFFGLSSSPNLKIVVADGFHYTNCAKTNDYDLIIMDAFGNDYIPKQMLTIGFFKKLKDLLTESGIIFINSLNNSNFANLETDIFNQVFCDYYSIVISSNKLIISGKNNSRPQINNKDQLIEMWKDKFAKIGVDIDNLLEKYQYTN